MLKLSLDNKVGTKMVKEVVDILTQEAEISLRLEGTMFRVINVNQNNNASLKDKNPSAQKHCSNNAENNGKPSCQIFGKSNHLAINCWYRFDYSYQSEDLSQALAAFSINDQNDRSFYVDS